MQSHSSFRLSSHDISDSDDDTLSLKGTSIELARRDREVLDEEEEIENLVYGKRKPRSLVERMRMRNRPTTGVNGNDQGILLREGARHPARSRSLSSERAVYMGPEKTNAFSGKNSRRFRFFGYTFIHLVILALFVVISLGAYRATRQTQSSRINNVAHLFNGTSFFLPTTILISLDGFRPDYLRRGLTPHLNALAKRGVAPKYMLPSFPSVTFPNHFTLVTGLHPESHGIVGNSFWDAALEESFYYTDRSHSMQPKWWKAEPIWETAERQGVRTAIHMWPGSEAHLGGPRLEPAFVDKFNKSEVLPRKVGRMLAWLDLPGPQDDGASVDAPRPQLIAAYVPDVDADGHHYGPNSTEMDTSIRAVDNMLGQLILGLEARNLTEIVNIVVVSDHGMAGTSPDRLIQLEDLLDPATLEHIDGWPHYGLRPKNNNDLPELYKHLKAQSAQRPGFDVYLRDQDMPERYHFAANPRIAPLWIMPHTGWAIVTKDEYDVSAAEKLPADRRPVYQPAGIHGYDNQDAAMHAIFIAYGPAFPHAAGSRVPTFQNIEVYNIVCDSIGLAGLPNNGTLRLPLQTLVDEDAPLAETSQQDDARPQDTEAQAAPPPAQDNALDSNETGSDTSPSTSSILAEPTATVQPTQTDLPAAPDRPTISDGGGVTADEADADADADAEVPTTSAGFWDWVKDEYGEFAEWVGSVAHGGKGKGEGEAGDGGRGGGIAVHGDVEGAG